MTNVPPDFEPAFFRYQDTHAPDLAWAWERVSLAAMESPEEAWDMILRLIRAAPDAWGLEQVGAGPLETLLANHGEAIIERVVEASRSEPGVRRALGYVWPQGGAIGKDVWDRIQAVVEGE